jgi:hypothetical protein
MVYTYILRLVLLLLYPFTFAHSCRGGDSTHLGNIYPKKKKKKKKTTTTAAATTAVAPATRKSVSPVRGDKSVNL